MKTLEEVSFLVKLMFRRLEKFDRPIFCDVYTRGAGNLGEAGGLIFGMLIGLHVCGAYIRGGSILA